ncbi:YbjQ family protein [Pseudoflavonifractor phocaeensis]|uniref:YbjQ family protein n=1 Tax=Pseudoflavonifractor phocaeensis TaxID=1870988 RepID=UPI00210F1664|nr:YbjQ family protein [Pseudoflavonifractor phocaeensis]MCQ4864829.1 YbjQ family protein [Pseudoflavonifractor phocaeensis]
MLLLNINYIPERKIQALGLVKGSVVQSKSFGKDFMSGMKNLVGGEVEAYTGLMIQARQIATKRMVDEAEALGADAIISVTYTSSSIMQGAAEVTAYGTAVRITGEKA